MIAGGMGVTKLAASTESTNPPHNTSEGEGLNLSRRTSHVAGGLIRTRLAGRGGWRGPTGHSQRPGGFGSGAAAMDRRRLRAEPARTRVPNATRGEEKGE